MEGAPYPIENMRTHVYQTAFGAVAKVPIFMPDRERSLRRLRRVIGRRPVVLRTGSGFTVYAAANSIPAQIHQRRLARFAK